MWQNEVGGGDPNFNDVEVGGGSGEGKRWWQLGQAKLKLGHVSLVERAHLTFSLPFAGA